jgi:hypothetical protein
MFKKSIQAQLAILASLLLAQSTFGQTLTYCPVSLPRCRIRRRRHRFGRLRRLAQATEGRPTIIPTTTAAAQTKSLGPIYRHISDFPA